MGVLNIYYDGITTSRYTESRSSYPTINYNNSTPFTFSPSNLSKEIKCSEKVMRSDLIIGEKTITCNNKIMRSNIKAIYSPVYSKGSNVTNLSVARGYLGATHVGNYALFAGGDTTTSNDYRSPTNVVDAYNTSLTRSTPTTLSASRYELTGGSVGNYALFAGGTGSQHYATVDAYNTSLTRSTPASLSVGGTGTSATSIGNYAIFGDPYGPVRPTNILDVYDTSLTKSNPITLSENRSSCAATTVGNYALFGGGSAYSTYYEEYVDSIIVDAYNSSLTRSSAPSLSAGSTFFEAFTIGNQAIFIGIGNTVTNVYDTSLTRTILSEYYTGVGQDASTTIDKHVLIGGGQKYVGSRRYEVYATVERFIYT